VELEGLGLLENPVTSSGFKPTTYWLQQSASNKLHHRMETEIHMEDVSLNY
jgi:hypothetical protein